MTEEQKKAIDACKDQAADHVGCWSSFKIARKEADAVTLQQINDRAIQLYGEQCRKEAIKHSWVNYLGDDGKTCPCHLCGEQTFGTYDGKPSCLRCAIRLKCQ